MRIDAGGGKPRQDGGAAMGGGKDKHGHKPGGREGRLGEALRANLVRRKQPGDEAAAGAADQAMLRRADRLKPKLAGKRTAGPEPAGKADDPHE